MIDPSRRLVPSTGPEDHPIHDAAEAGELARVRAFLDQQPSLVHDINRAGGHPLHRAVIGGSADVVTLLLDRGADIHAIHGAGVGSFEGYAPHKVPVIVEVYTDNVNRTAPEIRGIFRKGHLGNAGIGASLILSPPGALETPTAPMASFPTLIGTPPPTAITFGICFRKAFSGLSVRFLNSSEVWPRVRAV